MLWIQVCVQMKGVSAGVRCDVVQVYGVAVGIRCWYKFDV